MVRAYKRIYSYLKDRWSKRISHGEILFVIVVCLAASFLIFRGIQKNDDLLVETVKRQNLTQSIKTTGTVTDGVYISLRFQEEGKVSKILIKKGDKVKKGDILATLSNSEEDKKLVTSKNLLLAARARYEKVLEGSSNKEIKLAKNFLEITKKNQNKLIAEAKENFYSSQLTVESNNDSVSPTVSGPYKGTIGGEYKLVLSSNLKDISFSGLEKGTLKISKNPQKLGTKGLSIVFSESSYPKGSVWTISIPNKKSSDYEDNLKKYNEVLLSAQTEIAKAQAELDLKRATARQNEVDSALADIIKAQAEVDKNDFLFEKTILRSPIDGIVNSLEIKIGQQISQNENALVLKDNNNLYLESEINENEIKSLAVGQLVEVKFDDLPSSIYRATVLSFDEIDQKIKIKSLLETKEEIEKGMKANIIIKTANLLNVLTLPSEAIEVTPDHSTVSVLSDDRKGKIIKKEVTTGLKGDNGLVEIQAGLEKGEKVIWHKK